MGQGHVLTIQKLYYTMKGKGTWGGGGLWQVGAAKVSHFPEDQRVLQTPGN